MTTDSRGNRPLLKGPLKFVDSGSVHLRQKQLTLTLHNSFSADDAAKIGTFDTF